VKRFEDDVGGEMEDGGLSERLGPYIAAGTPASGEHFQSQL